MLTCPHCGSRLTRARNELGLYWRCGGCGGLAMGTALLRKVAPQDYVNRVWSTSKGGTSRSSRPCPACSRKMTEVGVTSGAEPILLDVCRTCHFVWFDPSEYETVPAAPRKPRSVDEVDEKELPQAAREALALYEVQQMAERLDAEESPDADWKAIPALFGLPVESDSLALQRRPWLTWSVAALIVIVNLLSFPDLEDAICSLGLIPSEAGRYGGLTFLTSFLLHAGWLHLLSNLYFLLVFGDNVEDFLGHWKFLLLLILSALVGDILHVLSAPGSEIPSIGASGGISGVIAFYALKFPLARLGLMVHFIPRVHWTRLPVWGWFAIWTAMQIVGAYQQLRGFSHISALAHLGGAMVGVGFWILWRNLEASSSA